MTIQNLYNQYLDGKITESKFLYEVRRDPNLNVISPTNSFSDVIKILKNKSIISEKAHKEAKKSEGKQEVEIIAKTIDMVNPYEYAKGMNYELEILDIPAPSGNLDNDNVLKAQKKVLANLTKNPRFYSEKINGKDEVSEKWVEATKSEIDKIGKGKSKIIREVTDAQEKYRAKPSPKPSGFRQQITAKKMIDAGKSEEEANKFYNGLDENYFSNYGADDSTYEEDETKADATYRRGVEYYMAGAKDLAERCRQLAIEQGTDSGQEEDEFPRYEVEFGEEEDTAEYDEFYEGYKNPITKLTNILKKYGNDVEVSEYMKSLKKEIWAGKEEDYKDWTGKDYIEDFKNYIADKGIDENHETDPHDTNDYTDYFDLGEKAFVAGKDQNENPFTGYAKEQWLKGWKRKHAKALGLKESFKVKPHTPPNEQQLAVYERYSKETGIPVENLIAMVREAKEKMEEAIALKDRAGNTQYAKDSTEASNIERSAKSKGVILTKTSV